MSDTVNGNSCSYVNLSNYNSSSAGTMGHPDSGSRSTVTGSYVVPNYGAIGYSALTHDSSVPSCSGYFNITSAYGQNADTCNTTYSMSPCNQ